MTAPRISAGNCGWSGTDQTLMAGLNSDDICAKHSGCCWAAAAAVVGVLRWRRPCCARLAAAAGQRGPKLQHRAAGWCAVCILLFLKLCWGVGDGNRTKRDCVETVDQQPPQDGWRASGSMQRPIYAAQTTSGDAPFSSLPRPVNRVEVLGPSGHRDDGKVIETVPKIDLECAVGETCWEQQTHKPKKAAPAARGVLVLIVVSKQLHILPTEQWGRGRRADASAELMDGP